MGEKAWTDGLSHLARGVGLFVAAAALQWLSIAMWNHESDTQVIWLPGPLLLSALLCEPFRFWIAYDLGWLVGMGSFAVVLGLPLQGMWLAHVVVLLLINAAAWVISRFRADQSIDDFTRLLGFLVVAVALLPLATAAFIAWLASVISLAPWLSGPWWHVGLADALGYAVLPPAIVSLANPASSLRRDALPRWNMLVITMVALVILWLGWRELGDIAAVRPLLLLAPVPLAIYVALRSQIPGTSVVNLVIGIIAIQLSLSQEGPFVQGGVDHTNLGVQLWMLGMTIASLFLAAMVEQRRTTQRALSASSSEVRELAGRLIVAQEQERARIARDLHDDINQRLAVASIRLSALRRKVDESNRSDVSQLQSELIALSEDVRHLSHDLHPSMLTQTGLTAALATLCQAQRHRSGPHIELKVSPHAKDLPEDVALCLYRVTQEGLGNAVRHAEAQRIEVALQIGDERVNLTIKDDGKGFAAETEGQRGLGLMSIDERTKLLGGSYGLQSTLGKGTELCICIPLGPYKPLHGQA
ncbi:sensor histidine kinase [Dyella jiangningensis]|uniref:Oxygen sensor histidine kinase NreB n=1 Tax=Dyella jiangningensis TaxID=1379159 RepID=A0A328P483_9GAMM|nr:ATP-binding protein [Dyella jiangningensis]RAO76123.1 sensor histidine kinase [Dyella jiangningensis]